MFKALLIFTLLLSSNAALACSMYKVSVDGKTMVGTNEDAWRTTSRIWFETEGAAPYKACFTGSRLVGAKRTTPQSGMNEVGLVFSRLSAHTKERRNSKQGLLPVNDEAKLLTDALRRCKTVQEVHDYMLRFDRSFFLEDVFIYIEQSGKYLIVEPYSMSFGNDASYVLSNFCPSITTPSEANKLERYRKGAELLNKKIDTSLEYCTQVSKAMHVCRENIGDGTLLTGIWNTKDLAVTLYFYHDYSVPKTFDLQEEFAKGDHQIEIPSLFPKNPEFENLKNYVTPFNTPWLRIALALTSAFLFFSSLFLLVVFFRKRKKTKESKTIALFALIGPFMAFWAFVMTSNINIYYFSAPYVAHLDPIITASAYLPDVLLVLILPFALMNLRILKTREISLFSRAVITSHSSIYLLLVFGFFYWHLIGL